MKNFIALLILFISINSHAQNEKEVTLVVTGSGNSPEISKQNALRSAIEQAFGVYISSKTEILNDDLIKDEVIAVSNGNIKSYQIISETKIPTGDYATTLNATVSINKLTSFVQKKGVVVEMNGGLFADNIKLQQLYEANELIAVDQICTTAKAMFKQSFDYNLNVNPPVASLNNSGIYEIKMTVDVSINSNYSKSADYVTKSLLALSCSKETIEYYEGIKKPLLIVHLVDFKGTTNKIVLRNVQDKIKILDLFNNIKTYTFNFKITSNVDNITVDNWYFKGFSHTELVQKNDRDVWYLFGGKENPNNLKYKVAYKVNNFYDKYNRQFDVCYSYYSGLYGPNNENRAVFAPGYFPLFFEIKEYANSLNDGLVLSLYNPLVKYITTHAIIHTSDLESINKISEYKVDLME
jgi:hypothetical protein